MFHIGAFFQSVNPANAFQAIAAVGDPALTIAGNDLRVPPGLTNLIGETALINDASLVRAQLQSPSLRGIFNRDIEPVIQGKVLPGNQPYVMHADSPIVLQPNESLNLFAQSNPAGAVIHAGLVWLADGARKEVNGNIFTIRWTAAAALAAGVWVNAAIVFSQVLPAGSYQVVGMRARGANLLAARLVFPGQGFRPGAPGVGAIGTFDNQDFRYGDLGVWGQFDNTAPPTIDFLGDTDVAQTGVLDLIKVK